MPPIKFPRSSIIIACLLLALPACTAVKPSQIPTPAWVATADAQGEYSRALGRWQSHNISDYEITVDIFSSLLPPPCSSRFTLVVTANQLATVHEIVTPVPVPLGDGKVIFNPGCHEYAGFTPAGLFKLVEDELSGKQPVRTWKVKFDPEYGYVTELLFSGGESLQHIVSSDFKIK